MGLTTAMYTGLSGLNVNQARIDTIGHNIANVNTTAFKGSRTLFQTQFSQNWSLGTPPSETSGGTNPLQIGLGATVGTTQRDHGIGSVETTGIATDLAVDGRGYFIVRTADGQQVYTRDGSFSVDTNHRLVTGDGNIVRGFGVDDGFNIVPGTLQDLVIPLGTLTTARSTENVIMDGDLSAAGTIATEGSEHVSQALVDGGGAAVTGATALNTVRAADAPGTLLFADGTAITVSGVGKGQRELPARTFIVGTTGSTLDDLASWLETSLGLQTDGAVPGSPGVTVENGTLVIRGNAGSENDLTISANDITTDNAAAPLPFVFTRNATANGSSVYTSFTAYDSLGSPVAVNVTFALDSTPNTGPVWRYYVESPDASGPTRVLGTGTVSFDTEGNFREATDNQFTLDRSDSGAATPLTFSLDFADVHGLSTKTSSIIAADQDGYPPGTLVNFGVDNDGSIIGTFDNGLTRTLGQVVVASFANEEGLVAMNENLYTLGPNSGAATVTTPGQFGAGQILSGALELSNVDLSREFIGLVTSSTGFQAASRVISVSTDLLNQLLLMVR
ncbi:MAG: flagellar hook-basal body complex protein [Phycisphaerae bacterium]|jgi:flagellar hook protein FlgE